jgi:biopolymer transport protein ExbD
MAEIIQEDKQKGGKRRPKKHSTRIDMTPMVDLMCLLITFFMLTTAFSKPKVMQIVLPEKPKPGEKVDPPKIAKYRTLNVILGANDKIYWYPGEPAKDVETAPVMQQTDYSDSGIRAALLERNKALFKKITDFENQVKTGEIELKADSVQARIKKIKHDDDTGPIVLIKPSKFSTYKNFVDIIDEMSIVGIGTYTVTDISWVEERMLASVGGATPTAPSNDHK